MELANKKFRNLKTGQTIKVIDKLGDYAILESKEKIKVNELLDSNKFSEQIDPSSFFDTSNAYSGLVDKIKNLKTENMIDESVTESIGNDPSFTPSSNESAVIQTTEEQEREELAKRYGIENDTSTEVNKQNQAFSKILNEEEDKPNPNQSYTEKPKESNKKVKRVEARPEVVEKQIEDPIITMFKNVKRNVDFEISVSIEDKIPRLDFIEMMEDSYETSIIDFLADKFTNKILNDPSIIKNTIKDKINDLVFFEENKKEKSDKNKKLTAKERINLVKKMKSIEEVEEHLKSEKAKTVIKACNKKIKELKND